MKSCPGCFQWCTFVLTLSLVAGSVPAARGIQPRERDAASSAERQTAEAMAWGAGGYAHAKVQAALARRLGEAGDDPYVKAWVFFTDKGVVGQKGLEAALRDLAAASDPRTVHRRALRRTRAGLFDFDDLPVPQHYIDAIENTGAKIRVTSRWLNAVSVQATMEQVEAIAELPFVRSLDLVRSRRRIEPPDTPVQSDQQKTVAASAPEGFYGEAEEQLTQINLIALHDLGFTGQGVVIGALDSGFHRIHPAYNYPSHSINVIAEYDFVDDDGDTSIEPGDPPGQGTHGTRTLSIMAGYLPYEYVGAAYDASYILCKTEDDTSETPAEEDHFVAGLEFIETHGGDVATSSLDYPSFYPAWQMDGRTAVITQAVNIATANGLICLNSTGNYNHDTDPNTLTIAEPVDSFKGIAVGSVDLGGNIAGSSSDGPTADGRVKPEVLARGVNTRVVNVFASGYSAANGTSFAVPLVAGTVACLLQAHPDWTIDQMRTYLFMTADYYVANGSFEPTYVRGYGIVDALAAHGGDCNGNGIDDAVDIGGATSTDCDANGVPDECFMVDCNDNGVADGCDITGGTSLDEDGSGIPDECECTALAVPLSDSIVKNRFLSFATGNPGKRTAVRVKYVDLPDDMAAFEGLVMWVGHPRDISEIAGQSGTMPPTFRGANLVCEPVYRDWGPDGVVHVFGEEIVPGAVYDIQEVEVACADPLGEDEGYSSPYEVDMPRWGDIVGEWTGSEWAAPDGNTNFDDIASTIDKFKNLPGAPSKTRTDLAGSMPDLIVDFSDVPLVVDAFKGLPYPFDGPTGCVQ